MMSRIRGKDTEPELTVRRILYGLGYRYRLHAKSLPGKPDIVFPARRKVIFVHGCFWHGHACLGGKLPSTRTKFWAAKIAENKRRDRRNRSALRRLCWESLVVWECTVRRVKTFEPATIRMLRSPATSYDPFGIKHCAGLFGICWNIRSNLLLLVYPHVHNPMASARPLHTMINGLAFPQNNLLRVFLS